MKLKITKAERKGLKQGNKIGSSKKEYLRVEKIFQKVAKENKLTTAELNALIWQRYSGTKWKDFKW